jgi:hypothetical protein
MKHHPAAKQSGRKARNSTTLFERIQPDAAGVDCGARSHFAAVPPDRDPQPVREFRTFTADLHRLADWFDLCGVKTVAMESTGVYWIPLYEILEQRGFEVLLVNAHDVHNVRGRKSDVSDREWLRELHSVGLLRASFRLAAAIVPLRAFLQFAPPRGKLLPLGRLGNRDNAWLKACALSHSASILLLGPLPARGAQAGFEYRCTMRRHHPSAAARAIRIKPAPTMTIPRARATRSPAGARRSIVIAAVAAAIARRSMTPMTRRIAVNPAQQ